MPTPTTTIDRTGYAANRRAEGWEGASTDTVPSGPSVSRDAEGAGTLPTPDAFSRYARVTASSVQTGRLVTAMPESTCSAPSRTTGTPTSVYRYYDADGRLIYVGVTSRGPQRQTQHAVTAEWWPHVRSQDVEHHLDRDAALRREKWLIERHRPPFNRQHNPDWERLRAAYVERCGLACEAAEVCDAPDECYAYVPGINSAWCGNPGCKPCHIRWHGYQDGVEAALEHVPADVYVVLEGVSSRPGPVWRLANEVFLAGSRLIEALEADADSADAVQMRRIAVLRENFTRTLAPEGMPF